MEQLGKRIRDAREARGVSQTAFAESCDLDRLYFGRLERGRQNPTFMVLLRIALELGVDAVDLICGIDVDAAELRAVKRPSRGPRGPLKN